MNQNLLKGKTVNEFVKKTLILTLVLLVMYPANVTANDCSEVINDCNVALEKCDSALKAKDEVIDRQGEHLDEAIEVIQNQSVSISELQDEVANGWKRQVLAGVVGAGLVLLLQSTLGR